VCFLYNEPTTLNKINLFKLLNGGKVKACIDGLQLGSLIRGACPSLFYLRLETKWSNYNQVEEGVIAFWRTEPVPVAKGWDELLLGVKGQSNLEIASSLRKLFR